MTYRAEQVWEAFKCELTSPPTDDMREALATAIRIVADRLCTDVGEIECPIEVVRKIADELEETPALVLFDTAIGQMVEIRA